MRYKKTTLKNGLRIVTVPRKDSLSVHILVLVDAGTKDETRENNGISHFLEHMCFKGTKKWPTSLKLSSAFDSLGANNNAFTSHDCTGYYASVTPNHAKEAVEILADMHLNPIYPEKEVEKEKGVIKEEIKLSNDKPTSFVWKVFTNLAYGDHPAGWAVLGTSENVNKISKRDLLKYRQSNYFADKTVITVAGKFDEEKMIKFVSRHFSKLPRSRGGVPLPVSPVEEGEKPRLGASFRPIDQTHLILGFRTVSVHHPDYFPLLVLSGVLGGGMSSRLFQKIREEMGAAYYVGATQSSYVEHGYLALYGGVDSPKMREVVVAMLKEVRKLKIRQVPGAELKRVKDSMIGDMKLNLETPAELAMFYGEQEVLRRQVLSPDEVERKIRKVSAKDLLSVAKKYFVPQRMNLALVGPHKETKSLEKLFKI